MKYSLFLILICLTFGFRASGHDGHYETHILREWKFSDPSKTLKASFYFTKNEKVFLEDAKGKIHTIPISELSTEDQEFVKAKQDRIKEIQTLATAQTHDLPQNRNRIIPALLIISGLFSLVLFVKAKEKAFAFLSFLFFGGSSVYLFSFKPRTQESLSILSAQSIDSAFIPFKPKVYTRWDQNWFYVESKGIADHEMMTGITKWQQQVPIPQCYTGSNAWQIPLNPVVAANPIPVNNQHFLRGAIAIAANGIPIFNPYTNTGVDAFLDGQLDNWGGHSGRADDYHYHIAPLHLYPQSNIGLPIAFGLDGYPVYGSLEPDGSTMQTLDEFHGHMGANGIYHYHGTPVAPYMIGKMKGQVTEDATLQIIPQPSAHPVRPSGTPLTGATITGFTPNGTGNGYNMNYTRNGQNYAWNYSWTANNVFTFNYVTPNGTTTTNYNGQASCFLPTAISQNFIEENSFQVFPNPAKEKVTIQLADENHSSKVKSTSLFDWNGKKVFHSKGFKKELILTGLPFGTYQIQLESQKGILSKTILVQ